MVRGPKKHLKRAFASHQRRPAPRAAARPPARARPADRLTPAPPAPRRMLDKLGGIFAPKPSAGPHRTRECLPLILLLRNRLKYALTGKEVTSILMNRLVQVDGKVRTDKTYPVGFMDVVTIPKTDEHFRLVYDAKGRFVVHRVSREEGAYKLCKVRRCEFGKGGVPYVATHDGRTLRYPDPEVRVNDTVMLDLEAGKIKDFVKFDVGNLCMATGGHNAGRVGVIVHKEKHRGGHDIVHVKDAAGHTFATRVANVFVIGRGDKPLVSLPKGKGIRKSILQEQAALFGKAIAA
jgi:small subunit ribosomal protein S4e